MKKALLLGLAMLTLLAPAAYAERGSVSVTATDTKEIAPDVAQITIEVQTEDKTVAKATEQNKLITNKIYDELNMAINKQRGDYVKTASYRVTPVYSYQNSKKIFEKYSVTNSVLVKVKDISLVSKLVDMATANGATGVNGLDFTVENYDKECNALIERSTRKAYTQAEAAANSIGSKLDGIKTIDASCSSQNAQPRFYGVMKNSLDATETASTDIEGGKLKIMSNVDATFFVK